VLLRTNAETAEFVRSLRARGVPAANGSRPDLLRLPAVRALLAFLRVVADPANSLELYALAATEPYRLSGQQLNRSLQAGRRRSLPLWESLLELLDDEQAGLDADTRRRLASLVAHVRAGIERSTSQTSGEVLYDYLRRSGMLARLARLTGDGPDVAGLRGIARFAELIRGRASLLAQDRVCFLLPHLERLSEQEAELDAAGPTADEVAVLTVHRAKGLEFKVVYLCGLVDGRFPVRSRPPLLSLPTELVADSLERDALAEERRLCYVAMTRAREELWLSYHTGERSRRRPSQFIAEAVDLPPAVARAAAAAGSGDGESGAVDQLEQLLQPAPAPTLPSPPTGGALSLSFSQVDEYLGCPERYRLHRVVGLNPPAHHALVYGSALHATIAAFHAGQSRGAPMSEVELLAEFARHWQPEGFLSRDHEEARYAAGQQALRSFRQRELASGTQPIAVERPFRFRLGPDQIVGRVDRLDRTNGGVVITDYKASDVRDQQRADSRARESLQLQVYALAQQAETGELPVHVQLHFLDSGVIGRATPDERHLERARQTLASAADGIRAGRFEARPNALACARCPFREICPQSAA
jgi:DNA helicase-2/ATP-dependent DNA helicase PcrA